MSLGRCTCLIVCLISCAIPVMSEESHSITLRTWMQSVSLKSPLHFAIVTGPNRGTGGVLQSLSAKSLEVVMRGETAVLPWKIVDDHLLLACGEALLQNDTETDPIPLRAVLGLGLDLGRKREDRWVAMRQRLAIISPEMAAGLFSTPVTTPLPTTAGQQTRTEPEKKTATPEEAQPESPAGENNIAAVDLSTCKPSRPITVSGQGTIIRNLSFSENGAPAIKIHRASDTLIINCDFSQTPMGAIRIANSQRVLIANCRFRDCPAEVIEAWESDQVVIQGCRFERCAQPIHFKRGSGAQAIGNHIERIGDPNDTNRRCSAIQLNAVRGGLNSIRDNWIFNPKGSYPEDVISIFASHGTKEQPILIEGNHLFGDPITGHSGQSKTGTAINIFDRGGSWAICRRNVIIAAGNIGIGICGGNDALVESNVVIGHANDGSFAGIAVSNFYKDPDAGRYQILKNIIDWPRPWALMEQWAPVSGLTYDESNVIGGSARERIAAMAIKREPDYPFSPLPYREGESR